MKKKFKKIFLFIFTLFICFCCSFVVNATILDDYTPTNGTQTLPLKTWDDIEEPNDLLGVTLMFNEVIRPVGLANNWDVTSYLQISYSYNFEEYNLESMPFIWGCNSSGIQMQNPIPRGPILRLQEEEFGDDPLSIFTGPYTYLSGDGLLFHLYDGDYEYNLDNFEYQSYWQYGPRMISFPLDQRDPDAVQLNLYVEGNNWDPNFSSPWQAFYAFLRRNSTIVYSSSMANDLLTLDQIHAYNEGYSEGFDDGYHVGYSDGLLNTDNSYRLPFLTGILNVVTDLLAIEILPNIRLGYFILLPLTLGVVGMIFYFWRKD